MSLLEGIAGPQDLRDLDDAQLRELAEEIRTFLVTEVSRPAATSDRTSASSS